MSWGQPSLLLLLLLVPSCAVGMVLAWRRRAVVVARFAQAPAFAALVTEGVHRARAWQAWLAVVSVAGVTLAAAGPRLGHDWQTQPMQGVTLVVVLDVSRSMDAADTPPSRMEQARRELGDLVAQLRGDAIGLVIFAAGSHVRIPPTVDYDTFLWATRDSASETLEAQGTHLAGALDSATQLLTRAKGSGKAILVVSDGEDHGSQVQLDEAVARAHDAGIRVYALGIGTPEGAPIPVSGGGFKKDRSGEVVVSKLQEPVLQRLAASTGGAYVRSVPSDDDVKNLYQDEIRGKLEAGLRGVRRERLWHERYQWPLALGVAAMVVSAALGIGRARMTRGSAVLLTFLLLGTSGRAEAGAAEDGAAAWRGKRWEDAVRLLGRARVEDPDDPASNWMLGDALLHVGRHAEAERIFRDLAARDPDRRAQHLYNAGHAAHRGGRLDQAVKDFEAAQRLDPSLGVAAKNLEAVKREIAARRQQAGPAPSDAQPGGEGSPPSGQPSGAEGTPGEGDGQAAAGNDSGKGSRADPSSRDGARAPGDPRSGDVRDATEGVDVPQAGGERASGDGGVRPSSPEGGTAEDGPPDDAASGESGEGTAVAGGSPSTDAPSGEMSREAAARLVEAVPDGRPRVVVHGETSEEDW